MLIDTHCHMNMIINKDLNKPFSRDDYQRAINIVEEAKNNNILKIINIGTNLTDSKYHLELAKNFKECYSALGIHPNDITHNWRSEIKFLDQIISIPENKILYKIVGIGETGLDFHYPNYDINAQKDLFKSQIELALKHDLALVVHSRDAADETLEVLDLYKKDSLRGTIHCFSYDLNFAKEAINLGFVLGIGGTLTYPKNNILREVVTSVGLDNIILETDAPFLAPQVVRGKENKPANIALIAKYISELLSVPYEVVCEKTSSNANKIFKNL